MEQKQWNVQIAITEDDSDTITTARAMLITEDGMRHESVAHARRNPSDRPVPAIGDELAVGRALSDLAAKLIEDGAADVAQYASPVR
ncbi:dsRBD fold-containing protein [Thermoactinospora rubra]|uniref:dsRBD fold-containing protein n=1 Tax=Thermoactinospora rubra TaxID=1088767 RepID=UPI000A10D533|nr:dsRBD fold-containing protein [Thermoactinospora rubra]